jgi:hypothetical protein
MPYVAATALDGAFPSLAAVGENLSLLIQSTTTRNSPVNEGKELHVTRWLREEADSARTDCAGPVGDATVARENDHVRKLTLNLEGIHLTDDAVTV